MGNSGGKQGWPSHTQFLGGGGGRCEIPVMFSEMIGKHLIFTQLSTLHLSKVSQNVKKESGI